MTERNASSAVTTALLITGISVIGSNSLALGPLLSDVARSLDADPVAVSRAMGAYGGATAISAFLFGPQIDRFGQRAALLAGLAMLALGTLLSAVAAGWPWLAAGQACAGLGAGLAIPSIYGLATMVAAPGQESRSLGRVLTGWSVSLVAGVPVAAAIADRLGWRAVYGILAAATVATLLGSLRLPKVRPTARRGAFRPSAALAPLHSPGVAPLLAICLGFMASFYGVYAFLGDHARQVLDLTAGEVGIVVAGYGVGFAAAGLGDRWIDRFGPDRLLPPILLAVAAVYALMIPAVAGFVAITALAVAWGFANHFGLNILVLLLVEARPDARGAVLALNSAVTYLAVLIGVGAAGAAYPAFGFPGIAAGAALLAFAAAAIALYRRNGHMQSVES